MRMRSGSHFLLAVCLVGFGILLLLVNTGIISVEITDAIVFCYPFLFFVYGVWLLLKAIITKGTGGSWFWGIFLILFGGLLSADRLGYITFTFGMVWKLWPFLLVYFGVKMLFGESLNVLISTGRSRKKHSRGWRMVSDVSYSEPNWSVEPIDRSTGVADYKFDFTKAFISETEIPIRLRGWVGDIKIIVPEDVEFSLRAKASVGDIKIGAVKEDGILKDFDFATSGYDEAERKLSFTFDFKVLDLRIDRV